MSSVRVVAYVLAAALAVGCDKDEGGGGNVGALEKRVKKLEDEAAKYREMLGMIHENFEQQKKEQAAQQAEEAANEPAPDAVFAVDIAGNQIEGPASGAYVTIIEAWDFA